MRTSIHLCTKDRHTETALALQSLRTQTYQDWDIIVLDDASGTPITIAHFFMSMINRLKLEGHRVKLLRNNHSSGVCAARNKCIEEDQFNNEFTFRLDDDVLLEPDYLERLHKVIKKGYDLASGVIPLLSVPEFKRETKFIGSVLNRHRLNSKGEIIENKDECGFLYTDQKLIPTHQFRTHALYKSKINEKVKYPDNLSFVGFREEGFFSFKCIIEGYKLAVDTGAVAYHLQTPSGGTRSGEYSQNVALDDETFRKWVKDQYRIHGNFLKVKI